MKYTELSSHPQKVMSKFGKSFYFASKVFSKKMMFRVSQLYSFCRFVDDCADEFSAEEAKKRLIKVKEVLNNQADFFNLKPLVHDLYSYGIRKEDLLVLVDGAWFDAQSQKIQNEEDLLQYCFKVAGVVGLMLCPLMKVSDKTSYSYAVDLGIAMQLTNICRDILEDAQNNRSYLPQTDLDEFELNLDEMSIKGRTPKKLSRLVKKYLDLADFYYLSASKGFSYIPLRPRFTILIALSVYRAIGRKIKKNKYNVLEGRVYLNKFEKIIVSLRALSGLFSKPFWFKPGSKIGSRFITDSRKRKLGEIYR